MLVRLKLTNAAIANVFNIGESAVKKRKSTLKKQGFHITDIDIIFEQIIEGLNL
jgi:biotin operon repressor